MTSSPTIQPLSAPELATQLQGKEAIQLLDVREPWEYELCHIEGSLHIPMGEISSRLNELNPDQPVACLCHHGVRSLRVAMFLQQQGFSKLLNVTGGIDAWAREVDSGCATY